MGTFENKLKITVNILLDEILHHHKYLIDLYY